MVLNRKHAWQKRNRRKKDEIPEAEDGHDEETQEKQEGQIPKRGVTILEMTVQQFVSLFMNGYRIAKEEGFKEKDAEDFGVFAATRFAALWMEDRIAQKKEAEQKEKKMEKAEDNEKDDDDE